MFSLFRWYERYLEQVISTYNVATICDGHYTTFSCSCLLLYCNKKIFVHHSILIDLADLVGETSRQIFCELAVIQLHLSISVGSRNPVLALWLKEKLQS